MMVKRIGLLIVLIGAVCMHAVAQQDPEAQQLLSAVSKQYRSYAYVKVDFGVKAVNAEQQTTVNEKGVLYLEPRSDKFHLATEEQEIISDGKTQWTILKDEQEVQVNDVDRDAHALTPANVFTFYQQGFKYVSGKDERVNGKSYRVADLTPLDNTKSFFKVRLRIDPVQKQLYDATVFDKSGNRYTYTILKFTPNPPVDAKKFIFDKSAYPGMEVVDLR